MKLFELAPTTVTATHPQMVEPNTLLSIKNLRDRDGVKPNTFELVTLTRLLQLLKAGAFYKQSNPLEVNVTTSKELLDLLRTMDAKELGKLAGRVYDLLLIKNIDALAPYINPSQELLTWLQWVTISESFDGDEITPPKSWVNSKWWPTSDVGNNDPAKLAFNNMVVDSISWWPKTIKGVLKNHGLGVGGNTVFDTLPGVLTEFESFDIMSTTLESFNRQIVNLGADLAEYQDRLHKLDVALDGDKILEIPTIEVQSKNDRHVIKLEVIDIEHKSVKVVVYTTTGVVDKYVTGSFTKPFILSVEQAMLNVFDAITFITSWTGLLCMSHPLKLVISGEPLPS